MDSENAEIMRYLGRRGQEVPPGLEALAKECMLKLRGAVTPRHTLRIYAVTDEEEGLLLENTRIYLRGTDIRKHLCSCSCVALFAATLGAEADNIIRSAQSRDITMALAYDACAAVLIEELCDEIEESVRKEAEKEGNEITSRFSPGYGDLPLETQPLLLAALDAARKIGLTCSESLIMLPRKSVTAIIGIGGDIRRERKGCGVCSMKNTCNFRR